MLEKCLWLSLFKVWHHTMPWNLINVHYLTELLCMVEMMWQPKNHEISNPAPGVFPKLSWVVWTHFWWFRVHIWAQNWAQTRKIRKYLKIRPNEMWWKKCLLIIKNAWDFGYLRDFPREFEWRIENWHFWKSWFSFFGHSRWAGAGAPQNLRSRQP